MMQSLSHLNIPPIPTIRRQSQPNFTINRPLITDKRDPTLPISSTVSASVDETHCRDPSHTDLIFHLGSSPTASISDGIRKPDTKSKSRNIFEWTLRCLDSLRDSAAFITSPMSDTELWAREDQLLGETIWDIIDDGGKRGSVPASIDTGCKFTLLNVEVAQRLNLEIRPTMTQVLRGYGGGQEEITSFVMVQLACETLKLSKTEEQSILITRDPEVSLLIGRKFIGIYNVLDKVQKAKWKRSPLPPPVTDACSLANRVSPIRVTRSKGQSIQLYIKEVLGLTDTLAEQEAEDVRVFREQTPSISPADRARGIKERKASRTTKKKEKVDLVSPSLISMPTWSTETSVSSVFTNSESIKSRATTVCDHKPVESLGGSQQSSTG